METNEQIFKEELKTAGFSKPDEVFEKFKEDEPTIFQAILNAIEKAKELPKTNADADKEKERHFLVFYNIYSPKFEGAGNTAFTTTTGKYINIKKAKEKISEDSKFKINEIVLTSIIELNKEDFDNCTEK